MPCLKVLTFGFAVRELIQREKLAMSQERLKVMLIEHDPRFAHSMGEMLGQARDFSAEISAVPDLGKGLSALAGGQYDVVVLDLSLPDGAGLGNVSVIKAKSPQLPIIVAGETDNEIVAIEAVRAGANDYLVKNQLNPGWLERSIRYAIERHRLDAALMEAEQKYHGIFDHLIEGIFQTSPDGRYLMANPALARIYGYSSPDELVRTITDIGQRLYVHPGKREEFVRFMQENDVINGFESEIYRKDGTIIWISENCRAVRDSQGKLLYYEGTVEDITLRRKAEERLRSSESLYHSLVETLPQNIFRKDIQGRFTFANQNFCRLLGRSLLDIIGKTDFDIFPAELAEKYLRDDRQAMASGHVLETTEEHQPTSGEHLIVQVVKTPLYSSSGIPIGLQGIFWDITQQRLAEEKIRRTNALLAQSRRQLRARNIQMEDDLKMAHEIQVAMLPQQYPAFPPGADDTQSKLRFTHRYLPTGTVGGDLFTISVLSDDEAGVFICDVAGHGVRSALVTAMIRALVEEIKPLAADPGAFLSKLNSDLYTMLKHTGSPLLTTGFYLVANWREGKMRFASAGHPMPLHIQRSAGQVVPLSNGSGRHQPALGLFERTTFQASEAALTPGDLVMLYTDGLYEVQGPNDTIFSQNDLLEAVRKRAGSPASEMFDLVLEDIRAYSGGAGFADDVCIVGVEVAGTEK